MTVNLTKSYYNNNEDPEIKETVFFKRLFEISEEHEEPLRYTYRDLIGSINRLTTALYTTVGLKKGDVVGFYMPNSIQYVLGDATVESSGLIMFQLNPALTSDQLERLFKKAKPSAIITKSSLAENIRKFNNEIKIILIDVPEHDIKNNNFSFEKLEKTIPDLEYINNIRNQIQPDDIMYYGCTSGSTGDPKICTYTNRGYTGCTIAFRNYASNYPYERRFLLFAPFYTTTGHSIMGAMFLDGIYYALLDKFEPEKIFKIIEREKINNLPGAPSAFLALMYHPNRNKYDLSSLKEIGAGGAAASNEFLEKMIKSFNLTYACSGFGMTEGCGLIYLTSAKSLESKIPSSPIKHFEVRIVDRETREVVDIGFPGELEYRAEIMMKEYLDNPEANKEAFTEDRWFKTGDEAVMEKNGFLKITGRIKEMIIRGGHNIWPNEIVDIINQHPYIQEAAVVGIPDKFQGESVVAFVIVKPNCKFSNLERELRDFLKDRLVPFSIPTYYFEVDELPRNSIRKVYIPKLKEMAIKYIKERFKKLEENNTDKPVTKQGKELAELWSKWFDVPINTISRSTNFFDMGGDSLVGVQTTALIKKYYEDIPFKFLNTYQTLGQIEDFLIDPESSIKIDIQLIKDFYEVKSKTANQIFGEINTIRNKNRKCVAVTGATGYLGVYVVNELCKRDEISKIYCIGRSSSLNELKAKMLSMMRKVNIEMNDKIELVIGDVTKIDCGIEPTKLEEIKRECNAMIHCAAVVNWTKTYGQLKEANVKRVINAMKVAGRGMEFVYISSFGAATKRNETLGDKIPKKAFAYIQTKWLSEHYVRKGKEIGINSTIIRPCFIAADSRTGVCNTDDFVYKFIRQCVLNKIAPSNVTLGMTPVDKVAKGIVDYMYSNHIINFLPSKSTLTDELFKVFNEKFNQSIEMMDKEKWMDLFMDITKDNEDALSIIPSLVILRKNIECTTDVLKGKNDFLNYEESDMIINFNKLNECGFFTKEGCNNLFGRTK
ncbi:putative acyl-CoA synthetase [Anaeromyces robustus]|uniref:Putative acyl-CoA synthetase n=1 Tax=Anaeromyces robustus TaxID=1754192 RepID=A0A1Y1XC05_9FUNG|nr:putative acyl-CoA synthetase [Anaeromyces robustus]|eukprot:ORX83279.1 putative acyl-CoA synthetase [Anaeromyces robustus]